MRRRRRRFRYGFALLWVSIVLLAGASFNIYLALRPASLEARVRAALSGFLQSPFRFSSFRLSWSGGAEILDLELGIVEPASAGPAPEDQAPLLAAPKVIVQPNLAGLLRGRFEVDQVVLDSPTVRVARDASGRWNFEGLLRPEVLQGGGGHWDTPEWMPAVFIEGGRVRFADRVAFPEGPSWGIQDVQASLGRMSGGEMGLRAELRLDFARKLDVSGTLGPEGGKPVLRLKLEGRKIDLVRLSRLLPEPLGQEVGRLRPRGFLDLSGDLKFDPSAGLVPVVITGKLLQCELVCPYVPLALKEVTGVLRLRDRTLAIEDLEGSVGGGRLLASARLDLPELPFRSSSAAGALRWSLKLSAESLELGERLRDLLPPEARSVYDGCRPRGEISVDLAVMDSTSFPPQPSELTATARLEGVDLVYREFPYPVENLRGEVSLRKGWLTFERPLEGENGPIRVTVAGKGAECSPDGELELIVKLDGVPLDEKFRSALPSTVHRTWDEFQVIGSADGVISIKREALRSGAGAEAVPGGSGSSRKPRISVTAYPRGARMSYRRFPYEIREIVGSFHLDTVTKRLNLVDLKGLHGDQVIRAEGVVEVESPCSFDISLGSDSLAVDDDLVSAMSETSRQIVSDFGFKGRAGIQVSVHSTGPGTSEVVADVTLAEGSVRHKRFPYDLQLAEGRLRLVGDHTVRFEGISTPRESKPRVVLGGCLTTQGSRRTLSFDFDIKDLEFDEKFKTSLPPELGRFVSNMKLGGVYEGRLGGTYVFDPENPAGDSIIYHGEKVSARDAGVNFGLAIRDIFATGSFVGGKGPGVPQHLMGDIRVDSAWFNRVHLTKGEILFAFGQELGALDLARKGKSLEGRDYIPPASFVERLSGAKVKDTFQMLVHSSDIYGGTVDGFIYVDTGDLQDVAGDLTGRNLEVSRAAEDIFGSRSTGSRGTAGGKVNFHGRNGDSRSIVGKGEGRIEKARLAEVPVFLRILTILFGEDSSRHFFEEVNLRFDIADGKFVASTSGGIEMKSSAVNLLGGGTLDFSGNLDLTLQPRFLGFKIPLLEQIFSLVKKGLAQVWVTGDLSKPKVQFVTGVGMLRIGIDPTKNLPAPLPSDLRARQAQGESGSPPPPPPQAPLQPPQDQGQKVP